MFTFSLFAVDHRNKAKQIENTKQLSGEKQNNVKIYVEYTSTCVFFIFFIGLFMLNLYHKILKL